MKRAWWLVLVTACAATNERIVKSPDVLLKEAKTLPIEDACKLLSDAMASGDYSMQRRGADTLSAMNDEYQIGHARETYCRQVEKREGKLKELGREEDLVSLRAVAWSHAEDEGVRRKAAQRLLELLATTKDKDVVERLAQMEVRDEIPTWYLAMGIEEAIERRYWQLNADAVIAPWVERATIEIATMQRTRAKNAAMAIAAAEPDALAGVRDENLPTERALCGIFSKAKTELEAKLFSALIASGTSGVGDAELKRRIETIAKGECP